MADAIPMRPSSSTGTDGALSRRHMWLAVVLATVSAFSGFGVAFVVLKHGPAEGDSIPHEATEQALRAGRGHISEIKQSPNVGDFNPDDWNEALKAALSLPKTAKLADALNQAMKEPIKSCTTNSETEAQNKLFEKQEATLQTTVGLDIPPVKAHVQNYGSIAETCANLQNAKQGAPSTFNPDGANCMGPLAMLIGTWEGDFGKSYSPVPAYSPMASDEKAFAEEFVALLPGQPTADFHAIKNQTYRERQIFAPIWGTVKNRGYSDGDPINPQCQNNQVLQGVSYTLYVYATNPSDSDADTHGMLHEEVGMWMYNSVPASGGGTTQDWSVTRMSIIPHGTAVVAVGNNSYWAGAQTGNAAKEALLKEQKAFDLSIRSFPQDCLPNDEYDVQTGSWGSTTKNAGKNGFGDPQPSLKDNNGLLTDVGRFLTEETKKVDVKNFATITVATGDEPIAQTPFIRKQALTTNFASNLWLSTVVDEAGVEYSQLQYAQRATWSFMQRYDCLKCKNGKKGPTEGTPGDDICYTSCTNLNKNGKTWAEITVDNPKTRTLLISPEDTAMLLAGKDLPTTTVGGILPTWTMDQIPGVQHHQCYQCEQNLDDVNPASATSMNSNYPVNATRIPIDYNTPSTPSGTLAQQAFGQTCKDHPLQMWPHIQVNTLRKVSNQYEFTGPVKSENDKAGINVAKLNIS